MNVFSNWSISCYSKLCHSFCFWKNKCIQHAINIHVHCKLETQLLLCILMMYLMVRPLCYNNYLWLMTACCMCWDNFDGLIGLFLLTHITGVVTVMFFMICYKKNCHLLQKTGTLFKILYYYLCWSCWLKQMSLSMMVYISLQFLLLYCLHPTDFHKKGPSLSVHCSIYVNSMLFIKILSVILMQFSYVVFLCGFLSVGQCVNQT